MLSIDRKSKKSVETNRKKGEEAVLELFDQETLESVMPDEGMFPKNISLAMSYVPNQPFDNLYDEPTALSRGTLFKSLDFPFVGAKRK